MLEIHSKRLWIGHAFDARDPRPIFESGIEAIIDVAYDEAPAQLPRQLTYCRFPLNDGGGNSPQLLLQCLRTATDLLSSGTPTLIACSAGMSRSPTVAAFALAHHLSESPDAIITKISMVKSLELKQQLWDDVLAVYPQLPSRR